MSKCNTSASFPLSAEAAIFARNGQKIGKSRHKFLRNFKFLRFCAKILGSRIKMRLPLLFLQKMFLQKNEKLVDITTSLCYNTMQL